MPRRAADEGPSTRVTRPKRLASELSKPAGEGQGSELRSPPAVVPKRTRSRARRQQQPSPAAAPALPAGRMVELLSATQLSAASTPTSQAFAARVSAADLPPRPTVVRQATPAEEAELAFLQHIDQHLQVELSHQAAEHRTAEQNVESLCNEAADWDQSAELEEFRKMELQEQRLEAARREAELLRMEEEEQRRIAEAVAAERHACCAALLQGAEILAGRASLADCTIDQLNSIQEAGQRLAALCQDGKETLLRNEKAALEQQVAKERALQAKREHEALVLQEKCRVLEVRTDRLVQQLERKEDEQRCCICFARPRNAQVLPCMHSDFCLACLKQHMRHANKCPICRVPIRGVLEQLATSS